MMRLSNAYNPLNAFEHDVNVTTSTKQESFKFLSVILKNLSKDDPKYRQLRLSNAKIQRLVSHSTLMTYLQHTIGFTLVVEDGERSLRCAVPPPNLDVQLQAVQAAYERTGPLPATAKTTNSKRENEGNSMKVSSSASSREVGAANVGTATSSASWSSQQHLSEKQKARLLLEKKQLEEKEADRVHRKRTQAQIAADKHVRENDPNWTPGVSAAAAKAGTTMKTFRDQFGEN